MTGNAFCGYILTELCTSIFACSEWDQVLSASLPPCEEEEEEERLEEEEEEVVESPDHSEEEFNLED